jgi:hypothetical protein
MKKALLTMFFALSAASSLLASEAEEWWRCPRDAVYARQEMFRQFGLSESTVTVTSFETFGVPVRAASLRWKTFGTDDYGYPTG